MTKRKLAKDIFYINEMIHYSKRVIKTYNAFKSGEWYADEEGTLEMLALQIQQIGEKTMNGKLSEKVKSQYDLPWNSIRGMRNLTTHEYHNIDKSIVRNVATHNIPDMLPVLEEIQEDLLKELEVLDSNYHKITIEELKKKNNNSNM